MEATAKEQAVLEDAEANYKVREDIGREGWHYGYAARPSKM
jgi:hypothetical protein